MSVAFLYHIESVYANLFAYEPILSRESEHCRL